MEGRLTEEQVTKSIIKWLESSGWEIICFDFPQSGTGVLLHSDLKLGLSKNKGSIMPDIVAIKNERVVFFENKDRFSIEDVNKVHKLKHTNEYSFAINDLLTKYSYKNIFYGIGMPYQENGNRIENCRSMTDFILFVSKEGMTIEIFYQVQQIFSL